MIFSALSFTTLILLSCLNLDVGAQTTNITGVFTDYDNTTRLFRQFLAATANDTSAVLVDGYGNITLDSCTVMKTGDTSDLDDSSFSDLNAAVAVQGNSTLIMHNTFISSYGQSANALHVYEAASSAYIYNSVVSVYDILSHGLYIAGGYLYAKDCVISTAGMYSGAISTDKGGGVMNIEDTQAHTFGELAACLYSTGNVTVRNLTCITQKAFAGVIDGNNTISITNSNISAGPEKYGVFRIFNSGSSSPASTGQINITNTYIAETRGVEAVFQTSNAKSIIHLNRVNISTESGLLFNISVADSGDSGLNGGFAWFRLKNMAVTGDTLVSNISTIDLNLVHTNFSSTINAANTGGLATLIIGIGSKWNVTGTSYLSKLTYSSQSQVTTNGYDVFVNDTKLDVFN